VGAGVAALGVGTGIVGMGAALAPGATIGFGGAIGVGGAIGIEGFGVGGVFSLMRRLLGNCQINLAKRPPAVKPPARDDAFFLV
jgi:hypothetical protein